jgi:hypothetical protein
VAQGSIAVVGLGIALLGGGVGVYYLIQLFSSPPLPLDTVVMGMAFAALALSLGGLTAWQGAAMVLRRPAAPFRPPPVWLFLLVYLPVLVVGQLLLYFEVWPGLTFPLFHVLAAAIPPLSVLAFAGRTLEPAGLYWREMTVHLAAGAFIATMFALIAEILVGVVIFCVAALLYVVVVPAGLAELRTLLENLQTSGWPESPANLENLLFFPPVTIALGLVFALAGPLLEELLKPLSILLRSYRCLSPGQAFAWGLASGAGFTLVENLFNTISALDFWAVVMLFRVGGSLMHCLGSGMTAWGWQNFLTEGRPWRLLAAYGASAALHITWNVMAIGLAGTGMLIENDIAVGLGVMMAGGAVLTLGLLTLAMLVGLVYLTRWLRAT